MSVSRKTLTIEPNNNILSFAEGDNLLDTLNANKIGISQSCGGNGTCTTCRVYVLKGDPGCVSPRNELESDRAEERDFATNERLACQTKVLSDLTIEIANSES